MNVADQIAKFIGTWKFIGFQTVLLIGYVFINTVAPAEYHFDSYPFVFLNLLLSFQAAYTAPILMISHNKLAENDVKAVEQDRENVQEILKAVARLERRMNKQFKEVLEEIEDDEEEDKK